MDLDDLFEHGRRGRKHGHHGHDDHARHGHGDHEHRGHEDHWDHGSRRGDPHDHPHPHDHGQGYNLFDPSRLARGLLANKKLVALAGVALLVAVVVIGLLALPLVFSLFGYVDDVGIKGIIDRLWQGSGAGK